MADILRIVNWEETFENAGSRKIQNLRWVALPNKHDSDGYTIIIGHPDGPAHYACWVTIVQVASKCHPRGTLLRAACQGHDSASLSRVTRIPQELFDAAIPRLIAVGWLERISSDGKVLEIGCQEGGRQVVAACQEGATEGKGREGKGREGKRTSDHIEASKKEAPVIEFSCSAGALRDFCQITFGPHLGGILPESAVLTPDERLTLTRIAALRLSGYLSESDVAGGLEAIRLRTDGPPHTPISYLVQVLHDQADCDVLALLPRVVLPPSTADGYLEET